ncbi:MAG: queuosine precursor transporter [Rhizobiaceae bacterium]
MTRAALWPHAAAMALVVAASNVLVQFPVAGQVGGLSLADLLTWGAFTYPFAFLVTDLANRRHGPAFARRVVFAGFVVAILCSLTVPALLHAAGLPGFESAPGRLARIAAASGSAFLAGQLLDVTVFNRMRRQAWWRAPALSSVLGSLVDTAVFFTIAFAGAFALVGPGDEFASQAAPLLGALPLETPRWISWALGDLTVKLLIAAVALLPYRLAMAYFGAARAPA